jgi:hypothetical protein
LNPKEIVRKYLHTSPQPIRSCTKRKGSNLLRLLPFLLTGGDRRT